MTFVIKDLDTVVDPDRGCELHMEFMNSKEFPFLFRYPIKYYPRAGSFWIKVKLSRDVVKQETNFVVDFSDETFSQFSEDTPDKAREAMDVLNAIMEGVFSFFMLNYGDNFALHNMTVKVIANNVPAGIVSPIQTIVKYTGSAQS